MLNKYCRHMDYLFNQLVEIFKNVGDNKQIANISREENTSEVKKLSEMNRKKNPKKQKQKKKSPKSKEY